MNTETEEKSLKYWFVLAAILLALVAFGLLESEPAQWLLIGAFWGIIVAGVAMNRARRGRMEVRMAPAREPPTVKPRELRPAMLPNRLRERPQSDDDSVQMTPQQRRTIEDHVKQRNEAAVRGKSSG